MEENLAVSIKGTEVPLIVILVVAFLTFSKMRFSGDIFLRVIPFFCVFLQKVAF